MTKEQVKQEFNRWIDAGQPKVWVIYVTTNCWELVVSPTWKFYGDTYTYIVDDDHAELRKLQIDKPDTKFQVLLYCAWVDTKPEWFIDREYRVKPLEWYEDPELVGKIVWVKDCEAYGWSLDVFERYDDNESVHKFCCKSSAWRYAKPANVEDLYKGE